MGVHLLELKNKGKVLILSTQSVCGHLQECPLFVWEFKRDLGKKEAKTGVEGMKYENFRSFSPTMRQQLLQDLCRSGIWTCLFDLLLAILTSIWVLTNFLFHETILLEVCITKVKLNLFDREERKRALSSNTKGKVSVGVSVHTVRAYPGLCYIK